MKVEDIMILRSAGAVKRMHNMRSRPQNLAEHSWGVAMLLLTVYPQAPAGLIQRALVHDLPELRTGDIPAFVKWQNPDMETILKVLEDDFHVRFGTLPHSLASNEERLILKWCDGAELLLYCIEELHGGNRYALEVLHAITTAIEYRGVPECCQEAWSYIKLQAYPYVHGLHAHGLPGQRRIYTED